MTVSVVIQSLWMITQHIHVMMQMRAVHGLGGVVIVPIVDSVRFYVQGGIGSPLGHVLGYFLFWVILVYEN